LSVLYRLALDVEKYISVSHYLYWCDPGVYETDEKTSFCNTYRALFSKDVYFESS